MNDKTGLMTYCYFLGLADAVTGLDDVTGDVQLTLTEDHREILDELAKIAHGITEYAKFGEETSDARAVISKYHGDTLTTLCHEDWSHAPQPTHNENNSRQK